MKKVTLILVFTLSTFILSAQVIIPVAGFRHGSDTVMIEETKKAIDSVPVFSNKLKTHGDSINLLISNGSIEGGKVNSMLDDIDFLISENSKLRKSLDSIKISIQNPLIDITSTTINSYELVEDTTEATFNINVNEISYLIYSNTLSDSSHSYNDSILLSNGNNTLSINSLQSGEYYNFSYFLKDLSNNLTDTINLNYLTLSAPVSIPDSDLLIYLPFSGNSNDISGNNYDAFVEGAVLSYDSLGIDSSAYYFDGGSDLMKFRGYLWGSSYSYSFWFKTNDSTNSYEVPFVAHYDNGVDTGVNLYYIPNQRRLKIKNFADGEEYYSTIGTIPLGKWNHLVLDCNNTNAYVYLNGSLLFQNTFTSSLSLDGDSVYVGNSYNKDNGYFGSLDNFRVFDDPIGSENVNLFYTNDFKSVSSKKMSTPTLVIDSTNNSTIYISWDDPSELNFNEDGFQIQKATSSMNFVDMGILNRDVTNYVHDGIDQATTRYYRIRKLGDGENTFTSDWSDTVSGTTTNVDPNYESQPFTPNGLAFSSATGFGTATMGAFQPYAETGNTSDLPTILYMDTITSANIQTSSNSGSFTWICNQDYPRIMIVERSGYIDFNSTRYTLSNDYLTIYGQFAPGEGLTLSDIEFVPTANHIVIQHIKFRGCGWSGHDVVSIQGGGNYILDHLSVSGGADEVLSISGTATENFTISNSIIAEPVGSHNYASLVYHGDNITYDKVWFHSASQRHPLINAEGPDGGWSRADIINTLNYNASTHCMHLDYGNNPRVNVVGNVKISGPQTTSTTLLYLRTYLDDDTRIYYNDNTPDNVGNSTGTSTSTILGLTSFYGSNTYDIWDSQDVEDNLKSTCGAIYWDRDIYDSRFVNELTNRTGSYPSSVPTCYSTSYEGKSDIESLIPSDWYYDDDGDGFCKLQELAELKNTQDSSVVTETQGAEVYETFDADIQFTSSEKYMMDNCGTGVEKHFDAMDNPVGVPILSDKYATNNRSYEMFFPGDQYSDAANFCMKVMAEPLRRSGQTQFPYGTDVWHAFSVYIPADYDHPTVDNNILYQWHGYPDNVGTCDDWRSPVLAVRINYNDRWWITGRYASERCTQGNAETTMLDWNNVRDIDKGGWSHFVIHNRFDYIGDGRCEIWVKDDNGQEKIVDYSGPFGYNDEEAPYNFVNFGYYYKYVAGPDITLYFDRIVWAKDGSLESLMYPVSE